MSRSPLIGSLPLSQTAIAESRIFACPVGTVCLSRATIAPVAHVAWIYRVPQLSSHNCACCAYYEGLLCCVALMAGHALTRDTLELVLAWIVVGCSRSWSHIMRNLHKQFCLALYFIWLCCVTSYIYIYRQVALTTISSSIVLEYSGKINWNTIKHR